VSKTLEPGTEIDGGKYRVLRLLGQGGMGSVFEAEHRDTKKRVAVKCLHPVLATDPEIAERLVREAQATARVRHPNVVDVYDVGRDGELVYLVMQYLEGETLTQMILRRDVPVHAMIALLLPAIRGVAAAHKQGVIHRDLKPDNIFLAREGDASRPIPKVLDFGISKLVVRGTDQRTLTRSGVAVGTPSYMSYEQLTGESDIDERADVYAFGVILYEALTGKVPYDADTFTELVIRFANSSPPLPKTLRPDLPTSLSRVVMWALAKDRRDRISTMDALALELEPFSTQAGFEAERTQSQALLPPPERPKREAHRSAEPRRTTDSQLGIELAVGESRHRKSRMAVSIVCGLLLMAAAGALLRHAFRSDEPRAPVSTAVRPAEGLTAGAATETPQVVIQPSALASDTAEAPSPSADPLPARPSDAVPPPAATPSPGVANKSRRWIPRVENQAGSARVPPPPRAQSPRDFGIY
jgi:serine/threonine protein kinase